MLRRRLPIFGSYMSKTKYTTLEGNSTTSVVAPATTPQVTLDKVNTRADCRTPAQFWHSQGVEGREMPRSKREKVARYYSKVISGTLSALDDGRQAQDSEDKPGKLPSRTYIEWILSALGFDVQDWTRMGDGELVRLNTCHLRQTDDAGHSAALRRFVRQRERLNEWQGEAGNPILIEHRVFYDRDEQRNYSEYRVPFAELLRDIIADAPVGTRDYHLKQKIKKHVRIYLERFGGTAKPIHEPRHPSPMSDAHRSASLALKAFEGEARKSGSTSAANLMRASFQAAFGDQFGQIFGPIFGGDNSQATQEDNNVLLCDKCGTPVSGQNRSNQSTCGEKESDQNFDAEDGHRRVRI